MNPGGRGSCKLGKKAVNAAEMSGDIPSACDDIERDASGRFS